MKFFLVSTAVFFALLTDTHAAGLDTYDSVKAKYKAGAGVRVLIVPGHDNEFYGTSYQGTKEADLTLELAKIIKNEMMVDPRFDVTLSRDDAGYNPDFMEYLTSHREMIITDINDQKEDINQLIAKGEITIEDEVPHADANSETAIRLYGLNSWADHEDFDLVVHVHFNDYGGRNLDTPGEYSGYSIYVPNKELYNAKFSKDLGDAIGKRLSTTLYKSNQPSEKKNGNAYGVIPDFYLIAMGAYKTSKAPRTLVEYSYIYEPQLQSGFLTQTANVLGHATAMGIQDFLLGSKVSTDKNLIYYWDETLAPSSIPSAEVLALQYALSELGFFPASGFSRERCSFTGVFGKCTKKSLMAFQKSKGIIPSGITGPTTRRVLNDIFRLR